jgi:hypothetical protein
VKICERNKENDPLPKGIMSESKLDIIHALSASQTVTKAVRGADSIKNKDKGIIIFCNLRGLPGVGKAFSVGMLNAYPKFSTELIDML